MLSRLEPGRRGRALLAALLVAGVAGLAPRAEAMPRPGEAFPSFAAKDLTGGSHSSEELRGHRTLVVVITDKDGGDEMQRWFDAATARLGKDYASTSLLSLHLPFFVSTGAAQGRARERVPREFWKATWLDKGDMAKKLGLPQSSEPFVFVLDARGRVLASAHGLVDDTQQAAGIWSAMSGK